MPSVDRDSSQDPVVFASPVPRPRHRFRRCRDRWVTIPRHPEPLRRSSPDFAVSPTLDSSFRPRYPPAVSSADVHLTLGPRSLDPAAFFEARLPSLFETRRRLPISATALRRAGNQTRALVSSHGRRPGPPSVSSRRVRLPCRSGDMRRATLVRTGSSMPVPLACASLPDLDTSSIAPPSRDALRHREDA